MAVHVEDHPVDYVNFEGVIPPDNYGAGAVIVWDRGQWIALNDIAAGFDKGKLLFELQRPQAARQMDARQDEARQERVAADQGARRRTRRRRARRIIRTTPCCREEPSSRSRASDPRGAAVAAKLRKLGAARRELEARDLRPMLATPGKPFSNPKWVFELKYDGYRLFAEKRAGEVKLYSRAGNDSRRRSRRSP